MNVALGIKMHLMRLKALKIVQTANYLDTLSKNLSIKQTVTTYSYLKDSMVMPFTLCWLSRRRIVWS